MRVNDFQSFYIGKILFIVGDDGVAVSQSGSGDDGIGCFYFLALSQVYALRNHIRCNVKYNTIGNKILYVLFGGGIRFPAEQFYLCDDGNVRYGIDGRIH